MFKISFWLQNSSTNQGNLEYITIGNPKIVKVENDMRDSRYACELYLSDIKYNYPPIYGTNPIDTLVLSLELAKIHLQGLIVAGYTISELESRKFWKLEKGKSLSERINELKNNKDISQDYKDKILMIMKENFGKIPGMKDQLYKTVI